MAIRRALSLDHGRITPSRPLSHSPGLSEISERPVRFRYRCARLEVFSTRISARPTNSRGPCHSDAIIERPHQTIASQTTMAAARLPSSTNNLMVSNPIVFNQPIRFVSSYRGAGAESQASRKCDTQKGGCQERERQGYDGEVASFPRHSDSFSEPEGSECRKKDADREF